MTVHTWDDVGHRLAELAETEGFTGLARVTRGDTVLLESAHGLADRAAGTAIHGGTRFALASMSKTFTAAAIMTAVGRGELTLDARVADVLPPSRRPVSMSPEVTVDHLLTHTSGIGDYAEEDEDLPGYVEDYGSLWRDVPCYRMERPDDFLPLYDQLPPVAAPGQRFHYCNAGYVLLGAVLEQVAAGEFASVVTERVLEPAGMTSSGYFRMDEPLPDVAVGYLERESTDAPWRSNIYSVPVVGGGDGGALATAADIDRFFRSVADGSLLGPDLTALMLTPRVPVMDALDMGRGFFLREGGILSHGGGDPGVEVLARHDPARDLTWVLLCNGWNAFDEAWTALESGPA